MRRSYLGIVTPLVLLVGGLAAGCGDDNIAPTPAAPDASVAQDGGATVDSGKDAATTPDGGGDAWVDAGADATTPHAEGWDLDYALPGLSGPPTQIASAIAVFGNRQVAVAGRFDYAGSVAAKNVAVWNGSAWSPLGAGLPDEAQKLVATSTGELYAVVNGYVGGDALSTIYKWDKTAWSAVAATTKGTIASIDVATDGTLFVGGGFETIGGKPLARGAKLVGTTWSALATAAMPDGWVSVIHATGAAGGACVGGGIDDSTFGVTCTDGATWTARKANLAFGEVRALTELGGALYAAGEFALTNAGQDDGGGLAKWNGTAWELVGGGVSGNVGGSGNVRAMTVSGTKICVTGAFPLAGGTFVRNVAIFDTATRKWGDLNGGILKEFGVYAGDSPFGFALATDSGGEIYVGGTFSLAGGRNALGLARWDGSSWNAVDDPNATRLGLNGFANTATVASDGSLYVGGGFSHVGNDVAANHVARLTGKTWSSLGSGLDGDIYGMTTKGSDLLVVGRFNGNTSIAANNLAKWNGATWSAVGGGLDGPGDVITTGPDGRVYVGGEFTTAGTAIANHIAAWDGTAWATFGDGLDGDVRAIGFDAAGKMYVGGTFTKAGGVPASNVATWDGTAWKALGGGVDDAVDSIAYYDGKITIGGKFEKTAGAALPHLAAWDGTKWATVGGGLGSPTLLVTLVQGLAVGDGKLYVTGLIETAGTTAVSHIARWDGTAWSDLAGGIDDVGEDVVATKDSVWAIGTFASAGRRGSVGIGRYWFGH